MNAEQQNFAVMDFSISKSNLTDGLIVRRDKVGVGVVVICKTEDNMHDRVAALLTAAPELLETLRLTATYLDEGSFAGIHRRVLNAIEKATNLQSSEMHDNTGMTQQSQTAHMSS